MKTTLTLALILGVFVVLAGGFAVWAAGPWWLAGLYGLMTAITMPMWLDGIGEVWGLRTETEE